MLQSVIESYLSYVQNILKFSKYTVANYRRYLDKLIFYVDDITPAELTLDKVNEFRAWLERCGLSPKTINYHLICLRQFLIFCRKNSILTMDSEEIDLQKIPEQEINCLTKEQIEKILDFKINTISDLRDKAIMETLYSTGLRVGELVKLDRDLPLDELPLVGKGGKRRLVFISARAKYWILEWLGYRDDNLSPLFINYRTQRKHGSPRRLSTVAIEKIIRDRAFRAGFTNVTPHTFRHSFATNMLRNGADLRSIQKILGHAQISTTQIYLNLTDADIKQAFLRCH